MLRCAPKRASCQCSRLLVAVYKGKGSGTSNRSEIAVPEYACVAPGIVDRQRHHGTEHCSKPTRGLWKVGNAVPFDGPRDGCGDLAIAGSPGRSGKTSPTPARPFVRPSGSASAAGELGLGHPRHGCRGLHRLPRRAGADRARRQGRRLRLGQRLLRPGAEGAPSRAAGRRRRHGAGRLRLRPRRPGRCRGGRSHLSPSTVSTG